MSKFLEFLMVLLFVIGGTVVDAPFVTVVSWLAAFGVYKLYKALGYVEE
jgi:hypothetical protein